MKTTLTPKERKARWLHRAAKEQFLFATREMIRIVAMERDGMLGTHDASNSIVSYR
jgi:hypothetical protein